MVKDWYAHRSEVKLRIAIVHTGVPIQSIITFSTIMGSIEVQQQTVIE